MNSKVDTYFAEGCGRCEFYQTPQCKVHTWVKPMLLIRSFLLETELKEDYKWSQPCYTLKGKNVAMLSALKEHCSLSFFKGALLMDPNGILIAPGKNSQADRQLRFTSSNQVIESEPIIKKYIEEAIELEKSGSKIDFKEKDELIFPQELIQKMDEDAVFKKAFESLTPGRQRSWNLHYTSAKKSSTRSSRIEKSKLNVINGKGWNER